MRAARLSAAGAEEGTLAHRRVVPVLERARIREGPRLSRRWGWAGMIGGLALLGACNATLDVSMNAQAVVVEQRYQRAIMSSFHGLFSLGGLVGAALASRPWQGPGIATMERLGDASYATYLGHILVINTAYYVMRRIGWPSTGLAAFAGYAGTLAAVLVYSWLHHRWIERPLYDLARRWIAPKQRPAHA